jgi:general secretion pathway protein G
MIKKSEIRNQKLEAKGFTLIELLIVISIIGVLASLLMVNFIGVRQRARDAQRKTDIRQIQAALEMYRADVGTYPDSNTFTANTCIGSKSGVYDCSSDATKYMQETPVDPVSSSSSSYYNGGKYCYDNPSESTYYLVACLENKSDSQGISSSSLSAEGTACAPDAAHCTSGIYYLVKNP